MRAAPGAKSLIDCCPFGEVIRRFFEFLGELAPRQGGDGCRDDSTKPLEVPCGDRCLELPAEQLRIEPGRAEDLLRDSRDHVTDAIVGDAGCDVARGLDSLAFAREGDRVLDPPLLPRLRWHLGGVLRPGGGTGESNCGRCDGVKVGRGDIGRGLVRVGGGHGRIVCPDPVRGDSASWPGRLALCLTATAKATLDELYESPACSGRLGPGGLTHCPVQGLGRGCAGGLARFWPG